ncbi:MAG: hypothetical protein K1W19_08225 [Lachnospiraceae bacterium]
MEEMLKNLYKQIEDILSLALVEEDCTKEENEMYTDIVNLKNSMEKAGYMQDKTFRLLVEMWNEETEDYSHLEYEVPIDWLEENVCNLEEFIEEYTSDESTGLYEQALLDGAVINERWVD